ncbi:hypothetical protein [Pseudoteredinibacter isoporae]|uniref:hypothetical protein n=1 Tax=Pseudoteredinibacter isoporae TaxID=570281 RepID=UPI00310A4DFE
MKYVIDQPAHSQHISICGHYNTSGGDELLNKVIKSLKIRMNNAFGTPNPSKADMINFLNKYKGHMYCRKTNFQGKHSYAHYLHSAYEKDAHKTMLSRLFTSKKYLYLKDGPRIDMNVVSYLGENKKPHTTVDYLDRLIQKAYDGAMIDARAADKTEQERDKSEENSLRWIKKRIKKKLNAKKFAEMPAVEQSRYLSSDFKGRFEYQ